MCGIAGFLTSRGGTGEPARESIAAMIHALSHRGPDDSGEWIDTHAGVALGHTRLSILDLSPLGHQPMRSRCGRYAIVFNGEIYNHKDLRSELITQGVKFRGSSDTEVLVEAIAHWGPREAVARSNGMFAIAAWDCKGRVLHLFRDRIGEKPLYYGWAGGAFVFASELKAIRCYTDFDNRIDMAAVGQFLKRGYIPGPLSIFLGIRKLPPGTHLRIRADNYGAEPEPQPYWSFGEILRGAAERPFRGTEAEASELLEKLLLDAVRIRMQSDVPLGALLSGGIDSSTVVAMMQAQSARRIKTFTIGFESTTYNEAHHAAAIAKHIGTDHTELTVRSREALEIIPKLAWIYDEPFADSSQIPTCLVSQLARRHVTVALSGDGGDELFGGYERYGWGRKIWAIRNRMPPAIRRVAESRLRWVQAAGLLANNSGLSRLFAQKLPVRNFSDKAERLGSLLACGTPADMYDALTSLWNNPADLLSQDAVSPPLRSKNFIEGWSLTEQMMAADTLCYLPDDILVKIDRAAMSVALEGRVPLLDHRIIELSWSLPARMRIHHSKPKLMLRNVLYRYVPRELIDRPKMGFSVPLGQWLRSELRPWAESLLSEARLAREGLLNPACIRKKWEEHVSGERDYGHQIWSILMLQEWLSQMHSQRVPQAQLLASR
ncbi:MAG TPA: asparagine synthase (glutamine-hydrolyzing) [Bryobacteraceae bacterium]|nr:asparagine synthase (glutamine-hydrolyzing) [Bryobacteraceae bacterium]